MNNLIQCETYGWYAESQAMCDRMELIGDIRLISISLVILLVCVIIGFMINRME